jgi:hypothetical protein
MPAATKTKLHVFVNRQKLDFDTEQLTREELMAAAEFASEGHDLFRLQGEGDPSGGTLVAANEMLQIKNGDRFRIIPGNLTFGS